MIVASSAAFLLLAGGCAITPETRDSGPAAEATRDGVVTVMEEDTISVRTQAGDELTFRTNEETALFQGDRKVGWDALAEGSSVRVGYDAGEGMGVARSVRILADPPGEQPWERQEHLEERLERDLKKAEDAFKGDGPTEENPPADEEIERGRGEPR